MPSSATNRIESAGRAMPRPDAAALARRILADALVPLRAGRWQDAMAVLVAQGEAVFADASASNLLGLLHAESRDPAAALACFDKALALNPVMTEALANRATTLQQLGRLPESVEAYDALLRVDPRDPLVHYNRATALHALGRIDAALAGFDAALALRPAYPEALANRGLILQTQGRLTAALTTYAQALALRPDDATTQHNCGTSHLALGNHEAALAAFQAALAIEPNRAETLCGAALALHRLRRLPEALARCDAVLRRDIGCLDALFLRGNILHDLRHFDHALVCYDAALSLDANHAATWCNRGATLADLQRPDEALASYDTALQLRPAFPEALTLRAALLRRVGRIEAALADLDAALAIRPDAADALCARGIVLKDLGRIDDAIAGFDAALAARPGDPHALNNKGATLLLKGDYARGWEGYESRWHAESLPVNALPRTWPEWRGDEPLEGRRVLVLDEQGLGDVIQFVRYLPLLVAQGATVTFRCRPSLHRLLGSLPVAVRLVEAPDADETFDFEIPLVSLPRAFRTDAASVPKDVPYLAGEPDRIAVWRARLGDHGLRVGVNWQGSPNLLADVARAVPLARFAPLATVRNVRLVSLQRNAGEDQVAANPDLAIETLGPGYDAGPDAFLDAAAVIDNLDLVVTCDTSIAHLAGALGRPVWVALKSVPDWRFGLEGCSSVWYPTMRLFRQTTRGDWEGVFTDIAAALADFSAAQPNVRA